MFSTVIRTLTHKKCHIVTINGIYDKTQYVRLLILPKTLIILHHPGWCEWWHFPSMHGGRRLCSHGKSFAPLGESHGKGTKSATNKRTSRLLDQSGQRADSVKISNLINQWINDKGVCRTAPASPGLLNTLSSYLEDYINKDFIKNTPNEGYRKYISARIVNGAFK